MTPTSPSSGIHFGLFAYQGAHIVNNNSSAAQYEGSSDGEMLSSVHIWVYMFDSVSIPQRALVQVVQLQKAWPSCLLRGEECPSKRLSLEITFRMQDALVSSLQDRLFPHQQQGVISRSSVWHNWIDQIHYILTIWFSWHDERRVFSVHYYHLPNEAAFDICDAQVPLKNRPMMCDM